MYMDICLTLKVIMMEFFTYRMLMSSGLFNAMLFTHIRQHISKLLLWNVVHVSISWFC